MPEEIHIDEEDATIAGKYCVPFISLIIVSLLIEQYWSVLDKLHQLLVIVILGLAATFIYRKNIREAIYT